MNNDYIVDEITNISEAMTEESRLKLLEIARALQAGEENLRQVLQAKQIPTPQFD